ncbi:MAG: aminotransferase class V-fold PLP-dependent enzyme [Steroidobacteraceae bacterium]|jgi:selenocysteine lyase/cysteine desulfurase|nr:aminotransferase class V-fold PLP-dependent enzyme [Steroidobacteraceae bacterium]
MSLPSIDLASLRDQVIGVDAPIETPFGRRPMVYCDYTASGRSLRFVERYLQGLLQTYANTHTEDDVTGRSMSRLLHEAEAAIKRAVNAGPGGCIVACGTGATGAIDRLQRILGVALPPATRETIERIEETTLGAEAAAAARRARREQAPVVFLGPYEHHSNEVSWRQGLATVVNVDLGADGGVDLAHLERLLKDPRWQGRPRIGSFSAASNVTGMRTPVHEIAALLHRHGAFACFDYAASGPYVPIDMNPDGAPGERSLDAVFLSPHKFLGGPGASGVLVFNERLYRRDLPPSLAGGGTVDYVSPVDQDFIADIEEREKAGTPGILQTLRAALAFELKSAVGEQRIEAIEQALLGRAWRRWSQVEEIEILGNPDPARRIGIVSFNLRDPRGGWLHPKFATALLNDLFGIQSRAGCSCAGPYGHRLLGIDQDTSEQYRAFVREGFHGIKPGWCRVGFHFVMDEAEADYVIEAVAFVALHGHRFLPLYEFDPLTGQWRHREFVERAEPLSLAAALGAGELPPTALPAAERARRYARYLDEARRIAAELDAPGVAPRAVLDGRFGALQFFSA